MHSYRPGPGQQAGRTRLLYLFRTPSNRKVGRNLLDPEVMEALEHTHPDLTFDWTAILRAPAQVVAEPDRDRGRPRQERQDRAERGDRGRRGDKPPRPERNGTAASGAPRRDVPVVEPAIVMDDDSLVGRTLGAVPAARMRAAYNDLVQRVARRARTPEERDRLIERATRLNPDEWPDAAAVTAGAATFDSDAEAIRQELPRRRRGRRGGRVRDREPGGSAIIEHDADETEMAREAGADDRGLDGDLGAGDAGAPDAPAGNPLHDLD
jgi:hypothetical protein